MTTPSIFISHSTKDPASASCPDAMSHADTDARCQRLERARALREAIYEELCADNCFKVFLDKRKLKAGMLWRRAPHRACRASGAVLLMTPEAPACV